MPVLITICLRKINLFISNTSLDVLSVGPLQLLLQGSSQVFRSLYQVGVRLERVSEFQLLGSVFVYVVFGGLRGVGVAAVAVSEFGAGDSDSFDVYQPGFHFRTCSFSAWDRKNQISCGKFYRNKLNETRMRWRQ